MQFSIPPNSKFMFYKNRIALLNFHDSPISLPAYHTTFQRTTQSSGITLKGCLEVTLKWGMLWLSIGIQSNNLVSKLKNRYIKWCFRIWMFFQHCTSNLFLLTLAFYMYSVAYTRNFFWQLWDKHWSYSSASQHN